MGNETFQGILKLIVAVVIFVFAFSVFVIIKKAIEYRATGQLASDNDLIYWLSSQRDVLFVLNLAALEWSFAVIVLAGIAISLMKSKYWLISLSGLFPGAVDLAVFYMMVPYLRTNQPALYNDFIYYLANGNAATMEFLWFGEGILLVIALCVVIGIALSGRSSSPKRS